MIDPPVGRPVVVDHPVLVAVDAPTPRTRRAEDDLAIGRIKGLNADRTLDPGCLPLYGSRVGCSVADAASETPIYAHRVANCLTSM